MIALLATTLGSVILNEISDRGTLNACGTGDWIEIANNGDSSQDLAGWMLCDADGCSDNDAVNLTGMIAAGAYLLVCPGVQERWIGSSDTITLWNGEPAAVDSTTLGGMGAFGKTW